MEYIIQVLNSPSQEFLGQLTLAIFWLSVSIVIVITRRVRRIAIPAKSTAVAVTGGFGVAHVLIAAAIFVGSLIVT